MLCVVFPGAELEGLVRAAASFALARNIDATALKNMDEKAVRVRLCLCVYNYTVVYLICLCQVEWDDFEKALLETVPAYGECHQHLDC